MSNVTFSYITEGMAATPANFNSKLTAIGEQMGLSGFTVSGGFLQLASFTTGITSGNTYAADSATVLTTSINIVQTTSGGSGSVRLPSTSTYGALCFIRNDTGATLNVFPATGDDVNLASVVGITTGKCGLFFALPHRTGSAASIDWWGGADL